MDERTREALAASADTRTGETPHARAHLQRLDQLLDEPANGCDNCRAQTF